MCTEVGWAEIAGGEGVISNISRMSNFLTCRTKSFNWDELRLQTQRTHIALTTGGSFHEGAAKFFSTRSKAEAMKAAEENFRERIKDEIILPEERREIEQQIELSRRMTAIFCENYADDEMQVLQPEVKFRVALPNTHHHCLFFHRILFPDVPFKDCQLSHSGGCFQPHYFQGKTDAVVSWKGKIWLLEHKTTAQSGQIFFDRFFLDFQPTGYLYGIGKATGVQPHGFILNVLKKPMKNAKDQLNVGFEREPYLRSEEDLLRFEKQFIRQCNDYESAFTERILTGDPTATYMNTKSCTDYRRRCEYFNLCHNHIDGRESDEFIRRPSDYINQAYYEVLGLPIPEDVKTTQDEEVERVNE